MYQDHATFSALPYMNLDCFVLHNCTAGQRAAGQIVIFTHNQFQFSIAADIMGKSVHLGVQRKWCMSILQPIRNEPIELLAIGQVCIVLCLLNFAVCSSSSRSLIRVSNAFLIKAVQTALRRGCLDAFQQHLQQLWLGHPAHQKSCESAATTSPSLFNSLCSRDTQSFPQLHHFLFVIIPGLMLLCMSSCISALRQLAVFFARQALWEKDEQDMHCY